LTARRTGGRTTSTDTCSKHNRAGRSGGQSKAGLEAHRAINGLSSLRSPPKPPSGQPTVGLRPDVSFRGAVSCPRKAELLQGHVRRSCAGRRGRLQPGRPRRQARPDLQVARPSRDHRRRRGDRLTTCRSRAAWPCAWWRGSRSRSRSGSAATPAALAATRSRCSTRPSAAPSSERPGSRTAGQGARHYSGRGSQRAACSGATTSVGNAAGPLEATPDAVAPKSGPSVFARPATLPPNAAQLPCREPPPGTLQPDREPIRKARRMQRQGGRRSRKYG
jgi:hypothetical protein